MPPPKPKDIEDMTPPTVKGHVNDLSILKGLKHLVTVNTPSVPPELLSFDIHMSFQVLFLLLPLWPSLLLTLVAVCQSSQPFSALPGLIYLSLTSHPTESVLVSSPFSTGQTEVQRE